MFKKKYNLYTSISLIVKTILLFIELFYDTPNPVKNL